MRIIPKPMRRIGAGYALIITLLFLLVCLTLLGSMFMWTSTNGKIAARNNTFIQSEAAAEAATETVFSQMHSDFIYGVLQTNTYYQSLIPDTSNTNLWPVHYAFSDPTNNVSNQTYVFEAATNNYEPLDSQYSGLYGDVVDCYITSTATPSNALYTVPATVSQYLQAADIPIFQFAIFYNLNMEMDPTPIMTINGPVFCNKNIWVVGINGLTFNSTVQAVGTVDLSNTDPIANNGYGRTGTSPVVFNDAKSPSSGNNALTMPIAGNSTTNTNPTNIEAILNLPPIISGQSMGAPNSIAYAPSNQVYLFNQCDLIISNASYGTNGIAHNTNYLTGTTVNPVATNFTIWFQDQYNGANILQKLTNDFIITKNGLYTGTTNLAATNILYKGFSFLTNVAFYDYRESDTIQAVQIDIAKFNKWLTNNLAVGGDQGPGLNSTSLTDNHHGIGSIYVYNSVPSTSTTLPAVRVANGSLLPAQYPGLTVATPFPIYVLGNYNVQIAGNTNTDIGKTNTTYTEPAALLGDAITILSTTWSDSYNSGTAETARNAGDTTVNAAFLEGIVESNPNVANNYSGGVENVIRYVEDWSGNTNTYNGSIVVMFPSIYATNVYVSAGTTGSAYYNPPTRNWNFDLNFKDSTKLPPCTPSSKAFIRGQWTGF